MRYRPTIALCLLALPACYGATPTAPPWAANEPPATARAQDDATPADPATALAYVDTTSAQSGIERFERADSEGVIATRDHQAVYLQIAAQVQSPIVIPRLAAQLRSMQFDSSDEAQNLRLAPKQDTWEVHWDGRPEGAQILVMQFDAPPRLLSEIEPTTATADGSFFLHAHLATTQGERIRYEPQPNKNTVGFWVGQEDSATWTFNLDRPGRFSVAILQGCGRGQGGSTATLTLRPVGSQVTQTTLAFEVVETGHFQNFQWVHIGEVELRSPSDVELTVMPKQIRNAALMDLRAIHLIRLPD